MKTKSLSLAITTKGNGDAFLSEHHSSLAVGGGMPGQGYGCVLTAYGFDQGATRDVGVLFLKETAKTLSNGTCPGHHNGVCITAYGFKPRQSAKARSLGFERDVFPTLEISQNSAVIYENNNDRHSED